MAENTTNSDLIINLNFCFQKARICILLLIHVQSTFIIVDTLKLVSLSVKVCSTCSSSSSLYIQMCVIYFC